MVDLLNNRLGMQKCIVKDCEKSVENAMCYVHWDKFAQSTLRCYKCTRVIAVPS